LWNPNVPILYPGLRRRIMTRTSKVILSVILTTSAIATISTAAHYVHPMLALTEVVDTDHYVQDLRARGIWYRCGTLAFKGASDETGCHNTPR